MAKHPATFACRIALCLCGVSALEGCGGPLDMNLAPVTTTGSVQSSVIGRRGSDGTTGLSVQEGASINVASYIWYPWFVRVRGGADVAHDKAFGDGGSSSLYGSASATLDVLPLSNYPVTLGLSHSDSRTSGEFGGADSTRDSAFITARAVLTQNLRGGLRANWDRSEQAGSGVQTAQRVNLDLNQTFPRDATFLGINSIGLNVNLNSSSLTPAGPDEEDESHQVATVRLSTSSEPFENLSYNSLMTATYDDKAVGDSARTRMSLQGVSTMQWRPEDLPFIVTGTLRTLTEKIEREGGGQSLGSDTMLAATTLGLRWPVNDQFSFTVGLQGSYTSVSLDAGGELGEDAIGDRQRFNAALLASANYTSEQRRLAGFGWSWNARASADNGLSSDEGMESSESIGLGHRFERTLDDLIFVPVRFSFAQAVNMGFDPIGDAAVSAGLSDSVSFSYSGSEAAASTSARLFLTDNRSVIGKPRETQRIEARIGRRVAISRERRLQGDLSAQAARQATEGEANISITASGNFSYSHRNVFGIENLGLRSNLRINVVNLDQLFGESDGGLNNDFLSNELRNTLTYRIGRLATSMEVTAFQRGTGVSYLALLRFRRYFGRGG